MCNKHVQSGMFVDVRPTRPSISETFRKDLLGFPCPSNYLYGFTYNGPKQRNCPLSERES